MVIISEIEKNVDRGGASYAPPYHAQPEGHAGRPISYPWPFMEVGDSILVSGSDLQQSRARGAAYKYGEYNNMKFASSKTDGGTRIWRIK